MTLRICPLSSPTCATTFPQPFSVSVIMTFTSQKCCLVSSFKHDFFLDRILLITTHPPPHTHTITFSHLKYHFLKGAFPEPSKGSLLYSHGTLYIPFCDKSINGKESVFYEGKNVYLAIGLRMLLPYLKTFNGIHQLLH